MPMANLVIIYNTHLLTKQDVTLVEQALDYLNLPWVECSEVPTPDEWSVCNRYVLHSLPTKTHELLSHWGVGGAVHGISGKLSRVLNQDKTRGCNLLIERESGDRLEYIDCVVDLESIEPNSPDSLAVAIARQVTMCKLKALI